MARNFEWMQEVTQKRIELLLSGPETTHAGDEADFLKELLASAEKRICTLWNSVDLLDDVIQETKAEEYSRGYQSGVKLGYENGKRTGYLQAIQDLQNRHSEMVRSMTNGQATIVSVPIGKLFQVWACIFSREGSPDPPEAGRMVFAGPVVPPRP